MKRQMWVFFTQTLSRFTHNRNRQFISEMRSVLYYTGFLENKLFVLCRGTVLLIIQTEKEQPNLDIMKEYILPVAILVASISVAPTANAQTKEVSKAPTQEQEAPYKEIQLSEVPSAVTKALQDAYPTAVLHKASISATKQYQLEVEVEGQRGLLFADANGNWIKK